MGVGILIAAAIVQGQKTTQGSTTPAPPPVVQTQNAPAPTDTPADPMPALPGMTQADVVLNLKQFAWDQWYGDKLASKCGKYTDPDTGGLAEVCLYGDTYHIGRIVAHVGASAATAGWLLLYVASVPFDGSDSTGATAWVKDHLASSVQGHTLSEQLGGAVYELYGDADGSIFLEVRHPDFEAWSNRMAAL